MPPLPSSPLDGSTNKTIGCDQVALHYSFATSGPYRKPKKIAGLRDEIREITDRRWLWTEVEDRVAR